MLVLNDFFKQAVDKKASDVHLVVGHPVIFRLDGELVPVSDTPLTRDEMTSLVKIILTDEQRQKFEKERELDISYEIADGSRFRVNLFWERDNIGLAARVINPIIPSMQELGLSQVVYQMIQAKQGLILVTGPTGCGKSTTLAALIDAINQERTVHIVTLEDPIEFLHTSKKSVIVQRQLGTDMLSFQDGLKHVLRQDPDVIMVGEMRDLETIGATITLAETGHLVLATLHTHNASQTIDRIVDVFPPYQQEQIRLQLSMSLNGIISQHLLPKKDGGRIAAREILVNTPAIANIIRENKIPQIKTVLQTSADIGMVTMEQNLKQMIADGSIDEQAAEYYLEILPKM